MHTIFAQNVNDAYRKGLALCAYYAEHLPSRNGPVRRVPMPVTTRYNASTQRVLFDVQRNANPFFHLFEGLWMLAGRQDVAPLAQFIPSFAQFSDDGQTLHGAYGYRWRHWPLHGKDPSLHWIDQLDLVIEMLADNPTDRRAVIGMWDPSRDLAVQSNDIPCNDLIKCLIVKGALDIQVFCRSNDIVFGCYGANAVHMSMLHEYLASMIGVPVGIYYQISGDFHAYEERPYRWDSYWPLVVSDDQYLDPYVYDVSSVSSVRYPVTPYPLVRDIHTFDDELRQVMNLIERQTFHTAPLRDFANPFFADVAQPMYAAHQLLMSATTEDNHAAARLLIGHRILADGTLNDWLHAALGWTNRIITKRAARRLTTNITLSKDATL